MAATATIPISAGHRVADLGERAGEDGIRSGIEGEL
jgi:hypothetical protein